MGGSGQSKPCPVPVLPAALSSSPSPHSRLPPGNGCRVPRRDSVWVGFWFIPVLPVTEQISCQSPWLLLGSRLEEVVFLPVKPALGPCRWVVLAESRPSLPGTRNWPVCGAGHAADPGGCWARTRVGLGRPGKQVKVNTSTPASRIALQFASAPSRDLCRPCCRTSRPLRGETQPEGQRWEDSCPPGRERPGLLPRAPTWQPVPVKRAASSPDRTRGSLRTQTASPSTVPREGPLAPV